MRTHRLSTVGIAATVALAGVLATPGAVAAPAAERGATERATVVRVIDGDTVKVRLDGGPRVTVRLLGIDTPEVHNGEECWEEQASLAAKRLLSGATRVRLISDTSQANRDRYGRLLRYVIKGRSKDVGAKLVYRGHAEVHMYNRPFERLRKYQRFENLAKRDDRGLWGHCAQTPPASGSSAPARE